MPGLLTKSGIRYLLKHKWQFVLSLIGIAIGVAIVVAIDIANYSTGRAFNYSLNEVTGKATHRIFSNSSGIPDSFYTFLKVEKGIKNIAPVIECYFTLEDSSNKVYRLLGIDVFAEKPFRNYFSDSNLSIDGGLKQLLTTSGAVLFPEESRNLFKNDQRKIRNISIEGRSSQIIISGFYKSRNLTQDNLVIADISTAQEISAKKGFIDYIDLIIRDEKELDEIKSYLPDNFTIEKSNSRSEIAEQMLDAFEVNLTALSLLALIVGIFLIYNTMSFSVVQRKTLIGTLRATGVTSSEIFRMILNESLFTGIIGTAIGITTGILISGFLIDMISGSVNDLYFVVSVNEVYISPYIIGKGILLGLIATLFSALKPAKEAADLKPRISMLRSEQEQKILKTLPHRTISGAGIILAGGIILLIPSKNIWLSYIGILPIIIGFALLSPLVIIIFNKLLSGLSKKVFGFTGTIALKGILKNISRTNTAIAALGIAVAATLGVSTMINSFRNTVVSWLKSGLNADLYITAPSFVSRWNDNLLPDSLPENYKKIKGVKEINFFRDFRINQDGNEYHIFASHLSLYAYNSLKFKEGNKEDAYKKLMEGDIIITEPFAFRNNVGLGSEILLNTDNGYKKFKVAGIYYDYASDIGYIMMFYDRFREYWNSSGITGISVYLDDQAKKDSVISGIYNKTSSEQKLVIRSNKYLLESSIEIFDRTFLIAEVLKLLSVIVAFVGILSSLMSLQLEKAREFGIMRANGLLPVQLFKIINLQTFFMGLISGLIALPLGYFLAAILVFIINKRSFGWTMQFDIIPSLIFESFLLAIFASVLAGIYPAYKMSKSLPALALKEE